MRNLLLGSMRLMKSMDIPISRTIGSCEKEEKFQSIEVAM